MRNKVLSALLLSLSFLTPVVGYAQNKLVPVSPYDGIVKGDMRSRISSRAYVGTVPSRNRRPHLLSETMAKNQAPVLSTPLMAANEAQLWGAVYSTKNGGLDRGFYSFTPSCDIFNPLFTNYYLPINCGAAIYDDVLHFISRVVSNNYWEYSTKTWTENRSGERSVNDLQQLAISCAYDATSGLNYGLFYNSKGDGWQLGTINYSTFETTKLADCDTLFVGMAMDGNNWYGISSGGTLSSINKATGSFTPIGYTGITTPSVLQAAAFDEATDKIYWAAMLNDTTSALYSVDPTTAQTTKIADFPDGEEITYLNIPWHPVDKAPGEITNLSADFANGSLTGTVTFTLPDVLADSTALSGTVGYKIFANGSQILSGSGDAGQTTQANVTLPEGGQTTLTVYADNESGHGRSATTSLWAGLDAPNAVTDLKASNDGNNVTLTWNAPTTTKHGGYADLSNVTYTVTRNPGNVQIATGLTANTYTDVLPEERARYSYSVVANAGGIESDVATTDGIVSGTTASIPYSQNFNEKNDIDLMTVIDADSDGTTWGQDGPSEWSTVKDGRAIYSAPWSAKDDFVANDWLLTPYIELSPDYTYTLSYDVGIKVGNVHEFYAVSFGKGDDVNNFTQIVEPTELNDMREAQHVIKQLTVSTEGLYRVGFQALSHGDDYGLTIDNISITKASLTAPDSVTELSLTPEARGNRKATISFKAPSINVKGNALGSLDKIDVYRDDSVLVKSLSDVQPGKAYSVDDEGMTDAVHKYTVIPANSTGEGTHAEIRGFIGTDRPARPFNIHLTDKFDGTAEMSWNEPHTGFYGYYVNPDSMRYTVYDMSTGRPSTVIADDVSGLSYTLTGISNHDNGDQGFLYYALSAKNRRNVEDPSIPILWNSSDFMITGAPMKTPFKESFAGAKAQNSMIWTNTTGNDNWRIISRMSYDYDGGCASFYTNYEAGEEATLGTGKISMKGMTNPKLVFRYFNEPDSDMTIKVVVNAATQSTDTVSILKFKDSTLPEGWQTEVVSLDDYKDLPYIWLEFIAQENSLSMPILIDDIELYDVPAYDLSLTASAENEQVNMGGTARVAARVENHSQNTANGANVKFYVGGKLFDEQNIDDLAPYASKYYIAEYPTKPTDADELDFKAVVEMANDMDDENNADSLTITMKRPIYPVVDDLTAVQDGSDVSLNWSAPENLSNVITESFEDYDPFIIDGIGDWETYDGDGGYTNYLYVTNYDNMGQPFAYQVMNPSLLGVDLTDTEGGWDALLPHSGSQYLISAQPWTFESFEGVPKDDWLISPQLDGNAQTINFWCRALLDSKSPETFEVLYSTGGTTTSDFQLLKTDSVQAAWTQFSYSLPEGTKHFAIHAISPDKYWFMLDDIQYTKGDLTLKGFNIYRDGDLIANVGSGVTAYTDSNSTDGRHTYYVTVVYSEGESDLSNPASLVTSAINNINAGVLYVGSADGAIVVRNATEPITVYTIGGATIGSSTDAQLTLTVKEGVYLVKVGHKTFKLQVK